MDIKIAQIWKITDSEKIYNLGNVGEYFIITHKEGDYYGIGCFWTSNNNAETWGGMRTHIRLTEGEIRSVGEYVEFLPKLMKEINEKK